MCLLTPFSVQNLILKWFLIINPVLTNTKKRIYKIFSNPEGTSFVKNNSEYTEEIRDDNNREGENMNEKDETLEIAGDIERTAINSFQHNTGNKGHTKICSKTAWKKIFILLSTESYNYNYNSPLAAGLNKLAEIISKWLNVE